MQTPLPAFARRAAAASLLLASAGAALAIDPSSARGFVTIGSEKIAIGHVVAVQRDNAEGLLDSPRELRIALTDREQSAEQLWGIAFLPVTTLASQGKVRGVLIHINPDKPAEARITVLAPPGQPGEMLATISVQSTGGAFPALKLEGKRVAGSIERSLPGTTPATISVAFSAPVLQETAVSEDLRGAPAKSSPQVKTLSAAADAAAKGDLAGLRTFMTASARSRDEQMFAQPDAPKGAELAKFVKQGGAEMRKELAQVQRVVVRGDRAVVLLGPGSFRTMVREDGAWKLAD